ncbi:MAG: hypothetical protein ACP5JJ_00540, partial [Anaerolineae bacterium]
CVHHGKPYADKPRLFLKEGDFLQKDDNAFLIEGNTIRRRVGGQGAALTMGNETLLFEDSQVRIQFSPQFEIRAMTLKGSFSGTRSLKGAAEMAVIFKGIVTSSAFLTSS